MTTVIVRAPIKTVVTKREANASFMQGRPIDLSTIVAGQLLKYDGTKIVGSAGLLNVGDKTRIGNDASVDHIDRPAALFQAKYKSAGAGVFTGASAEYLVNANSSGEALYVSTVLQAGAAAITSAHGLVAILNTVAGYAGVISGAVSALSTTTNLNGGTFATARGARVILQPQADATVTTGAGLDVTVANYGTLVTGYGVRINQEYNSGAIINYYGLRLDAPTGGGSNPSGEYYAIYSAMTAQSRLAGDVYLLRHLGVGKEPGGSAFQHTTVTDDHYAVQVDGVWAPTAANTKYLLGVRAVVTNTGAFNQGGLYGANYTVESGAAFTASATHYIGGAYTVRATTGTVGDRMAGVEVLLHREAAVATPAAYGLHLFPFSGTAPAITYAIYSEMVEPSVYKGPIRVGNDALVPAISRPTAQLQAKFKSSSVLGFTAAAAIEHLANANTPGEALFVQSTLLSGATSLSTLRGISISVTTDAAFAGSTTGALGGLSASVTATTGTHTLAQANTATMQTNGATVTTAVGLDASHNLFAGTVTSGYAIRARHALSGGAITNYAAVRLDAVSGAVVPSGDFYAIDSQMTQPSRLLGTLEATGFRVGGNAVVGARGAAVADPSGGSVIDVECRAQLSALLARLRPAGHGLIA